MATFHAAVRILGRQLVRHLIRKYLLKFDIAEPK